MEVIHMMEVSSQQVTDQPTANGWPFSRIRRITGYLTDDTRRWNTSKQDEERDRLKNAV